jgi:hypothetical protein
MDICALPVGVSALACAIAEQIKDNGDLALLAALLSQLGDTLATIVATRELCSK